MAITELATLVAILADDNKVIFDNETNKNN